MSGKFERLAAGMAEEVARLDRIGQEHTGRRAQAWQQLLEHVWWGSKSRAENEAIAQKWVDEAAKQAAR